MKAVLMDLLTSLAEFGFKNVIGINAHGDIDHNVAILETFKEASETLSINSRYAFSQILLSHYGLTGDEGYLCPIPPSAITVSTSAYPDVHAGDIETATMNRFYPRLTDTGRAKVLLPVQLGEDKIWSWLLGGQTQQLSPDGYLGAPADFEKVDVLGNLNDIASRVSEAILKQVVEV